MTSRDYKKKKLFYINHCIAGFGSEDIRMRRKPFTPSAVDMARHFRLMSQNRLPECKMRRKSKRLSGGWGTIGPTTVKTDLVTPTAQAFEQTKSTLRAQGDKVPGETRKRTRRKGLKRITSDRGARTTRGRGARTTRGRATRGRGRSSGTPLARSRTSSGKRTTSRRSKSIKARITSGSRHSTSKHRKRKTHADNFS